MSATSGSATADSFARLQPGCATAFGLLILLVTAGGSWAWYADRQARVRNSESWRREAERVTEVYEAISRDERAGKPGTGDPFAGNHREMAGLLKDNPLGREAARPSNLPYLLTLIAYVAFGLMLLVL